MFGISFSELFVITIVALLVIGPEKLPKVARTIGALTGRVQRYVGQVKEEVNRELRFEELQKLQQEIKQSVESAQSNIRQQVSAIENSISPDENAPNVNMAEPESITVQKTQRKPRAIKAKADSSISKKSPPDKNLTKKIVQKTISSAKKVEL